MPAKKKKGKKGKKGKKDEPPPEEPSEFDNMDIETLKEQIGVSTGHTPVTGTMAVMCRRR